MKNFTYFVILSIIFSLGAFASNNRLIGDIDGDGKEEIVVWKWSHSNECGNYYRVYIYRKDGTLMWQSPKSSDIDDDYAFGEWDYGISLPEVLIDFNGDGDADLLSPAPMSDISPQYYRIFTWNGKGMAMCRPAVLMLSLNDPNRFIWVNPYPKNSDVYIWASKLQSVKNSSSEAIAEVFKVKDGNNVEIGKALLQFYPFGAKVKEWIKPISYTKISTNNIYTAKIGKKDHYNSRGVKLNNINAILRQDRVNYYNGNGDIEDTGIGRFNNIKERQTLDKITIEPINISMRDLKKAIINGNPLLQIEVFPTHLRVKLLKY